MITVKRFGILPVNTLCLPQLFLKPATRSASQERICRNQLHLGQHRAERRDQLKKRDGGKFKNLMKEKLQSNIDCGSRNLQESAEILGKTLFFTQGVKQELELILSLLQRTGHLQLKA